MAMNGKKPASPDQPAAVVSDVGRFAIVPTWLLSSGVSDRAVRLYALLAGKYANYDTKEAFPSRRALATDISCSLSTLDRTIDELSSVSALTVERRQASNGDYISNIYKIRFVIPEGGPRPDVVVPPTDQELGGVASPVTIGGSVTGDASTRHRWIEHSSPVTTQETNPINEDQERTPLTPLAGGTHARVSIRKPSKAEQAWAETALKNSRVGCPHEPRCDTRSKCIGKLVMFQRQQTLEGMHEELGVGMPVPPPAGPAAHDISQHADTS